MHHIHSSPWASTVPYHRRSKLLLIETNGPISLCQLSPLSTYVFSHVWLCATPWTIARQAPLSMGILQARIQEWVVTLSSRGSSQPRDQTLASCGFCISSGFITAEPLGKQTFSPVLYYYYLDLFIPIIIMNPCSVIAFLIVSPHLERTATNEMPGKFLNNLINGVSSEIPVEQLTGSISSLIYITLLPYWLLWAFWLCLPIFFMLISALSLHFVLIIFFAQFPRALQQGFIPSPRSLTKV